MKKLFLLALLPCAMMAQETDSIHAIEEVILIGKKKDLNLKQAKPLSGIDDYLQQVAAVAMIKRGGYAWEPFINGMATERTVITIEGMHIFGACTDKMDPVTSYVEVSNLMEANVTQGIDLKRNRSGFTPGWKTMVSTGFETANNQKIAGGAVSYATPAFFIDTDAMFRDASNYTAGNNREVKFSQFTKLNLSAMSGV
ncbi:MAG TPA: TonB-dependent receptor, partial [Flavobacterium sp.]|nr:TonB-dependent receptor [Flavobacterium sp.]